MLYLGIDQHKNRQVIRRRPLRRTGRFPGAKDATGGLLQAFELQVGRIVLAVKKRLPSFPTVSISVCVPEFRIRMMVGVWFE